MHDVTELYRRLANLRGAVTGSERILLDAMRDAICEANEALGLDAALSMPRRPPEVDPEQAREDVREAMWQ